MKSTLLALATALAASTSALAQDAALDLGRERSEAFLAGELQPIWDEMVPEMQQGIGSIEALESFHEQVLDALGEESTILEEETHDVEGFDVYVRISEWTNFDGPIVMQWAFAEDGDIAGFFIEPQPQAVDSAFLDYETKADLRLPFDGEWFVFWGGRDIADNYHAADPAQRFAYDFLVLEDGASFSGDPEALESYHCWGREILAPADGEVIATVADLPDNPLGETDPENPAGNHVILALDEDEFAFLAHLQQGSVTVQQGDTVAAGDVLGLCGNSGNTSEPHLHLHLQTTPDLEAGDGLPAQFQNYVAEGQPVERGEPQRGETISPAP